MTKYQYSKSRNILYIWFLNITSGLVIEETPPDMILAWTKDGKLVYQAWKNATKYFTEEWLKSVEQV